MVQPRELKDSDTRSPPDDSSNQVSGQESLLEGCSSLEIRNEGGSVSDPTQPVIGAIGHFDLTVDDAPAIRDFYASVVGWDYESMPVDDYEDYVLKSPTTGDWLGGVCHRRGQNSSLPRQWLMYVNVADLAASTARVRKLGGKVLHESGPGEDGSGYAVIEDPAGAVLALMEPGVS